MKKILILVLILISLSSCNNGENNSKNIKKQSNSIIESKKENKKIIEIKKNLDLLEKEGINNDELDILGNDIKNMLLDIITEKAEKANNLNICENLSKPYVDNCKFKIILKKNNINDCEKIKIESLKKKCKNSIIKSNAISKLDENFCEKIKINEKEKYKIDDCKDRVLYIKAKKNNNQNDCKKILDKFIKKDCLENFKK